MKYRIWAVSAALYLAPAAAQAGDILFSSDEGAVIFRGSYGITGITANELVYEGKTKTSQLAWKSQGISTFTGEAQYVLDKSYYLKVRGTFGLGGDGYMANHDWFVPGGQWTYRSQHPSTSLDHYYVLSFEGGREILSNYATSLSLGGGVKYTDVRWTARGGSFVYSDIGYGGYRGNFPDGKKTVSYRQQLPVSYLALNASHTEGAWTFGSALQGGIAIDAVGIDDRWMSATRFRDRFGTTPAVMISGSAEYEFWTDTSVFFSGTFDRMFRTRADTTMTNKATGEKQEFADDAGADFQSITLSLGLKGKF